MSDATSIEVYDVVIIGGGPAGTTAAIYTARAGLSTLVIHLGLATGAVGMAGHIANFPGVAETVSGIELIRRMREQAESFGAHFVQDRIVGASLEGEIKAAAGNQGYYQGRTLIIATGAMGRTDVVAGEEDYVGRGVSYCATCDGAFFKGEDLVVAGNNDEALEEALFLTRFASKVYLLVQTSDFKASADLVERVSESPIIEIHYSTRLQEIIGEEEVTGVRVTERGGDERVIPAAGVFVYLQGRKPVTGFVEGQLPLSSQGCLEVDDAMQTGVSGVFAIGDVLCNHLKQIVVAAGDGAIAARAVERYLSGRQQLRPDWAE